MGAINKVPSVHFLGNKSSFPLKNGTLVAVVSIVVVAVVVAAVVIFVVVGPTIHATAWNEHLKCCPSMITFTQLIH